MENCSTEVHTISGAELRIRRVNQHLSAQSLDGVSLESSQKSPMNAAPDLAVVVDRSSLRISRIFTHDS